MPTILHFVFLGCIGLVLLFFSVLWVIDMLDKVSTLKEYLPQELVKFAEHKTWHGVFLLICWICLITDGAELYFKEVPEVAKMPPLSIPAPPAPNVTVHRLVSAPEVEPDDSLRKRTMKLADEWTIYVTKRLADPNKPPDATPNSANPHPSEEEQKAIQKSREFYRAIEQYYAERYRPKFIGIIEEYKHVGVDTHFLESTFAQFTPYPLPEGSVLAGNDMLSQFRELAYHVDGRSHLFTIPY